MTETNGDEGDPISKISDALDRNDQEALDRLVADIYPELKQFAHFQLMGERAGHTLSTTAIVHEAFVRMREGNPRWNDRAHFFRIAARVMRHLLVDHARKKQTAKRGSGVKAEDIEDNFASTTDDTLAVLALDDAMKEIVAINPRLEEIIECRYFAGLSVVETAEALDMAVRTVERDWQRARVYLARAMETDEH